MSKNKKNNFFGQVYETVNKIPKGKVATYGQIAQIVGTKDARKVGWALHANKDASCPCHRVVSKEGRLAANFAFDGEEEQRRRLLMEKVKFKDRLHVDLKSCLWKS